MKSSSQYAPKPVPLSKIKKNQYETEIDSLKMQLERCQSELIAARSLLKGRGELNGQPGADTGADESEMSSAGLETETDISEPDQKNRLPQLAATQSELNFLTAANNALQAEKADLEKKKNDLELNLKSLEREWDLEKSRLHENIEKLKSEKNNIDNKYHLLKKNLEELNITEDELTADQGRTNELATTLDVNNKDAPATFTITLYRHGSQELGVIRHSLSEEKAVFHGLDSTAIASFMSAHKPAKKTAADGAVPAAHFGEAPGQRGSTEAADATKKVYSTYAIKQGEAVLKQNKLSISSEIPFVLSVEISLPKLGDLEYLPPKIANINIYAVLLAEKSNSCISKQSLATRIEKAKSNYLTELPIPSVVSGVYQLAVYISVPLFLFSETKNMEIISA